MDPHPHRREHLVNAILGGSATLVANILAVQPLMASQRGPATLSAAAEGGGNHSPLPPAVLAGGEAYPIHYAATALLTQAVFDDPDVRVPAAILRSLALTRQTHTLWDEPQPGTALVLTEWSRCPVPPELWPPVHFVGFLIRLAPSNRVRKALAALNELVVEAAYGGLRAGAGGGGGGGEAPAAPISLWDDARGLPVRLYADIIIRFGGVEQEEEGIPAHRAVVAQISEFCAALVAPQWTSSSSTSSSSSSSLVSSAGQPDCIATSTPRNVWVGCLQFAYTGTVTSANSTASLAALAEFATFIGFATLQRACTHLLAQREQGM